MKNAGLVATRRSLVDRLANWDDQKRWQEFFDTYWKLIYSTARKSGLTDAEAQEVVQETVITVAKKIDKLKYDPAIGSFKGWLLQITRWRIVDCYVRKEWPAQKVADQLRVNIGQVYLARHRVSAVLKKEIRALEKLGR